MKISAVEIEAAVDVVMEEIDGSDFASSSVPVSTTRAFYAAIIARCRTAANALKDDDADVVENDEVEVDDGDSA